MLLDGRFVSTGTVYSAVRRASCRAAFLEDAGDHLIQRRILHAHVHHGVAIENRGQHLGTRAAIDLQFGDRPVAGVLRQSGRDRLGVSSPSNCSCTSFVGRSVSVMPASGPS